MDTQLINKKPLRILNIKHTHNKSQKYKKTKNYQVYQQSIFLLILSKYGDIYFDKPIKRSTTTSQFLNVKEIRFSKEDIISVNSFIEKRCEKRMKQEIESGLSHETALRRYETNKFIESLHFLIDLLTELHFTLSCKLFLSKNGLEQKETINEIRYNSEIIFNKNDIQMIGEKVNSYISKMIRDNKRFILLSNNEEISKLTSFQKP
ncbi:hypothetical protein ENUP19_0166G0015 [Entamoeba nuttalli]|uniref:Uncharacterized protein n=2 Tax=Entamoeba nuttalli TaxID=412467 RepID=K2GQL6_ENTNP|nr:hypothetical protein ENU1_204740 [Entamoeba nuttalli P19]EKE37233.1 hypothetical protein ENU1_204740 [Entamoeba nuttalli P19]|eukprot:XP_008860443.1 hypothetical protein ENU1_204740 [Entamoeba nuttalli P19]